MDKMAANNYLTKLRKEIKKAKAMVGGNLTRKIKELNKEKEKVEQEATTRRLRGIGKGDEAEEAVRFLHRVDERLLPIIARIEKCFSSRGTGRA